VRPHEFLCHTSPFDFTRRYVCDNTCWSFEQKCPPLLMMPLVEPVNYWSAAARKVSNVMYAGRGFISSVRPFLSLPTMPLGRPTASWFCPTFLSTLQSVFKRVEALSVENAALREEIREIRLPVEPTTSVRNCEVEQIWPADCNSGVKPSHSCPAVSNRCAKSAEALHSLPPRAKEGAKNARHPRRTNPA